MGFLCLNSIIFGYLSQENIFTQDKYVSLSVYDLSFCFQRNDFIFQIAAPLSANYMRDEDKFWT